MEKLSASERYQLLRLIEDSFPDDISRPFVTKRVARAIREERRPTLERCKELAGKDSERRWKDVTDRDIELFPRIFVSVEEDAMHFYFPAYLSYCIRTWNQPHHEAHQCTLEIRNYLKRDDFKKFSEAEMAAVSTIFETLKQKDSRSVYAWEKNITDLLEYRKDRRVQEKLSPS